MFSAISLAICALSSFMLGTMISYLPIDQAVLRGVPGAAEISHNYYMVTYSTCDRMPWFEGIVLATSLGLPVACIMLAIALPLASTIIAAVGSVLFEYIFLVEVAGTGWSLIKAASTSAEKKASVARMARLDFLGFFLLVLMIGVAISSSE